MARRSKWMAFGFPVLIGLSLLSAGLADFLFYQQIVGWTLGGFAAWLLLLIFMRHGRVLLAGPRAKWGWALALMSVGLCISLVLEPGVLAFLLLLIALGSLSLMARGGWPEARLGWRWVARLSLVWFTTLFRPILDSRVVQRWRKRSSSIRGKALAAVKLVWGLVGVVIPVILSLVFLGLFSLANPVIADWMGRGIDRVSDLVFNVTEYVTFTRLMLWYFAGFVCWGLLRYRPRHTRTYRRPPALRPAPMPPGASPPTVPHPIQAMADRKRDSNDAPPTMQTHQQAQASRKDDVIALIAVQYQKLIVRSLMAMNAVFAVQLVLDSRYLVLGQPLPEGMSYAEYAHRGAYPLIVTAILAAAMVLAVFRPGGVAQRSVWARRLVLLWIAQNVVLVVSAVWRLAAYVDLYTLTRLRVAAAIWMLMVAGCLVLLLWRIARSRDNTWLTGWAMGWGLCVLWLCSFVPFDPMIARYNVMNCQELGGHAGPIDVGYLEHLGPDALPAIAYLIENLPDQAGQSPSAYEVESSADARLAEIQVARINDHPSAAQDPTAVSLHDELANVQSELSKDLSDQLGAWRGWTVRRAWLGRSVVDER